MGEPGGLLRFECAEWVDPSERPGYWQSPGEWPSWWLIGAYQRYLVAVRVWQAEHGVTWEQWQQMKRHGGVDG